MNMTIDGIRLNMQLYLGVGDEVPGTALVAYYCGTCCVLLGL